jgi:hypothetical protein
VAWEEDIRSAVMVEVESMLLVTVTERVPVQVFVMVTVVSSSSSSHEVEVDETDTTERVSTLVVVRVVVVISPWAMSTREGCKSEESATVPTEIEADLTVVVCLTRRVVVKVSVRVSPSSASADGRGFTTTVVGIGAMVNVPSWGRPVMYVDFPGSKNTTTDDDFSCEIPPSKTSGVVQRSGVFVMYTVVVIVHRLGAKRVVLDHFGAIAGTMDGEEPVVEHPAVGYAAVGY